MVQRRRELLFVASRRRPRQGLNADEKFNGTCRQLSEGIQGILQGRTAQRQRSLEIQRRRGSPPEEAIEGIINRDGAEILGDPGVNNLRIYAHCLDDRPQTPDPVIITHAWTEKGAAKSKTVTLEKPGQYEIVAAHDPVDVSIAISVPSSRKQ